MKHQAAPKSSFAFLSIAFLNTFVDIGHKALMMDTVYATSTAHQYTLLSSIVNALMILPYLFLMWVPLSRVYTPNPILQQLLY